VISNSFVPNCLAIPGKNGKKTEKNGGVATGGFRIDQKYGQLTYGMSNAVSITGGGTGRRSWIRSKKGASGGRRAFPNDPLWGATREKKGPGTLTAGGKSSKIKRGGQNGLQAALGRRMAGAGRRALRKSQR